MAGLTNFGTVMPPSVERGAVSAAPSVVSPLAVLFIVGTAFFARSFALLLSSINSDEGVYLVMAQQWLHGNLPYAAVWDQHPPGLPALLALVQTVVADPVLGARLAATCAVAFAAVIIHLFCVRHARRPGIGLVAALLYIVSMSRYGGLPANTELFNNALVAGAAYLLFGAIRGTGNGLPRALLAALLLGIGLQIKYVILPEAVLLCLGYLVATYAHRRDILGALVAACLLMVAGCLPTGIAVGYFWHEGLIGPFLDANITSNVTYVSILPTATNVMWDSMSGVGPLVGPVLLILYAAVGRDWRPARLRAAAALKPWLLLWTVAALIDIVLPLKFYPHYFLALYPPLCMLGALALGTISPSRRATFTAACAVLFLTSLPLWMTGVARATNHTVADAGRTIAQTLRKAGARNGDVFVYNYQPVIYALAGVRPPTPYVIRAELVDFALSSNARGGAEINRVMDAGPRFVVVDLDQLAIASADPLDHLMQRRLASYQAIQTFNDGNGERITLMER